MTNGIPSNDTFNRVFSSIDSEQFEACFMDWVSHLVNLTDGEIIPIDGKTIEWGKIEWEEVAVPHGKCLGLK